MKTLDLILKLLPIMALFAGLFRYLTSEIAKKKERRVKQLLELRNQIQDDEGIAQVMFLCETNSLTHDFYLSTNNKEYNNTYKEIVKTLGLFDSMCYSFLTNNLDKSVFLYFIGEMGEIISNPCVLEYLDYLVIRNMKMVKKENIQRELLFGLIYPYGYFQLCMRLNPIDVSSQSSRQLKRTIKKELALVNKELFDRFY